MHSESRGCVWFGEHGHDVSDDLNSIIHKCLDIQMRSEEKKNLFFEIYLAIPDIDLEKVSSIGN